MADDDDIDALPLISATMGVDDEILDSQELLDLNIVEFPNQQARNVQLIISININQLCVT